MMSTGRINWARGGANAAGWTTAAGWTNATGGDEHGLPEIAVYRGDAWVLTSRVLMRPMCISHQGVPRAPICAVARWAPELSCGERGAP